MSAMKLIEAIQSCDPSQLSKLIATLGSANDREAQVNSTVPNMQGLTALHVAAKAYSAHSQDAKLAPIFNEMVRLLLEAGANPVMSVGTTYRKQVVAGFEVLSVVNPGQNVIQVCEGRVPPALLEWYANTIDDNRLNGMIEAVVHPDSPRARAAERMRNYQRAKRERLRLEREALAAV